MELIEAFITALPDIPRWVEVRGMLLAGRGHAYGVELAPVPTGVVFQPDIKLAAVVGQPELDLIREIAQNADEILAVPENADWVTRALSDWTAELATLHVLSDRSQLPEPSSESVRLLNPEDISAFPDLPVPFREELEIAFRAGSAIAAAWSVEYPVAFCYAGAVTETLWDVAISTLTPYHRRGYATKCFHYLAHRMAQDGKKPVWGAAQSNLASARLAAKLGFDAIDSLFVYSRVA
ncbi:MAG: GNAT family N-acetyltransferase [Cyanobacteria bacterium P01_D01_bin.44]